MLALGAATSAVDGVWNDHVGAVRGSGRASTYAKTKFAAEALAALPKDKPVVVAFNKVGHHSHRAWQRERKGEAALRYAVGEERGRRAHPSGVTHTMRKSPRTIATLSSESHRLVSVGQRTGSSA